MCLFVSTTVAIPPIPDLKAPERKAFLVANVNNLTALSIFAAQGHFLVVSVFNTGHFSRLTGIEDASRMHAGYRDFAANWFYSLWRMGGVSEVLLATYDRDSLRRCLSLGLACFNGASLLQGILGFGKGLANHAVTHGDQEHYRIAWAKPIFIRALMELRRGYSILYSDLDTIWVKDATQNMARVLDESNADVTGMREEMLNTGVLLFRSNERTRALLRLWTDNAYENGQLKSGFHDQRGLYELEGKAWRSCINVATCLEANTEGIASVFM